MATRVLELRRGGITPGGNNYDTYLAARQAHEEQLAAAQPTAKQPRENDYKQRKERESTIRRLHTAVRRTEEEVARLEEEIAALEQQLADPAVAADYEQLSTLTAALEQRNGALEAAMTAWETAQQQLEELEE